MDTSDTGAATRQANSEASKSLIARVPLHPRLMDSQNRSRPTPKGDTTPMPVIATRESTPEDGAVRVAVSDTGPGIPPDQRERIFERFVQGVDGADAGAAGLGLAIVRDIVQAHGGRIHLESEVGRGSRFTLELPRS